MFKKLQHFLITKLNPDFPNFKNIKNKEFHAINSAELNFYNLLILETEDFFKQNKKNTFRFSIKNDIDPLEGLHESIVFSSSSNINNSYKFYDKQLLSRTADLWAKNGLLNFYLPNEINKRELVVKIIKANIYDKSFHRDERFKTYKEILNQFLSQNNLTLYEQHVDNFIDSLKQKKENDILIEVLYDDVKTPAVFLSTSRELLYKKEQSYINYLKNNNINDLLTGIAQICEYLYDANDSFIFKMEQQNKKATISLSQLSNNKTFTFSFNESLSNMFNENKKEMTASVNQDNLSNIVYTFFRRILCYDYDLMKTTITKEKVDEIVISIDNKKLRNLLLEDDHKINKSLKKRL